MFRCVQLMVLRPCTLLQSDKPTIMNYREVVGYCARHDNLTLISTATWMRLGRTPLFNAILCSNSLDCWAVRVLLELRSNSDHVHRIDKRRKSIVISSSTRTRFGDYFNSEQVRRSVAHPNSVAYDEFRDESNVPQYKEESERLKECKVLRSMYLCDFLHDRNQLTANATGQVKHSLDYYDCILKYKNYLCRSNRCEK